ncbi:MAG: UvrD-helicase domain-containing protein [Planctomycetes bacterium]|nr:UvrD-helicase domain-containing protein [Planctomycetota bacterium]
MVDVDVFKDMNPRQRDAIAHLKGPQLVIAGAGSGKTRVITHRIANIIQHGTRPDAILAITFTNKAAGEMQERVWRMLHMETPWITTFHSAGLRILKLEEDHLRFENPFTIMDDDDQKRLMKNLLKSMELYDNDDLDPRYIMSQISRWKNNLKLPGELKPQNDGDAQLQQIYYNYEKVKKQDCLLDFDDLLLLPVKMFQENEDVLVKYQEKFPYILIDEYQDTNDAQYAFIRLLGAHGNVCATGDPDQAIYGWRGADIRNILDFEKDFPGCNQVYLEQNYRSTKVILQAAQSVVEHNKERKEKNIFTDNPGGEKITMITVDDNHEESKAVTIRCRSLHEKGVEYKDIAVFYRVNAQSRTLEEEFIRQDIPYRIIGGTKFYDRLEVKDVLAYLKLMVNPRDSVAFDRIVNTPARGIGEKTLQVIKDVCYEEGVGFHELFMEDKLLDRITVGRSAKAIREFARTWRRLHSFPIEDASACVQNIISMTHIDEHYRQRDPGEKGEERVVNIYELQAAAQSHGGVASFLDHVALFTSVDNRANDANEVLLMTLHASKGLEFPYVFMTGCEQGILPLVRKGSACDYEEERRLMYVGITRAMKELYLSRAVHRLQYGEMKRYPPSMFLAEIPDSCIRHRDATGRVLVPRGYDINEGPSYPDDSLAAVSIGKKGAKGDEILAALKDGGLLASGSALAASLRSGGSAQGHGTRKKVADDAPIALAGDPFAAGDKITHNTMGEGEVVKLSGPKADRRISINFVRGGIKELILSFALPRMQLNSNDD